MNDKLKSMFEDIQGSLNRNQNNSGSYKEILKLEKGHTYTVRFVPNMESPRKTFFAYKYVAFNSFLDGSFCHYLSPATYDDPCPLQQESFKIGRNGSDEEKERGKALWTKNAWLVNVYIIDDPTTPENIGTVKILRMGKQLKEIVDSALTGDDKDEFGLRIIDLSPEGCNFKIKVNTNEGGYPSYTMSRFYSPSEIAGIGNDKKKIAEIHESIHDLEAIYPVKTYQELKDELQKHYYEKGEDQVKSATVKEQKSTESKSDQTNKTDTTDTTDTDELPFTFSSDKSSTNIEDDIDSLLSGLDD